MYKFPKYLVIYSFENLYITVFTGINATALIEIFAPHGRRLYLRVGPIDKFDVDLWKIVKILQKPTDPKVFSSFVFSVRLN